MMVAAKRSPSEEPGVGRRMIGAVTTDRRGPGV